MFKKAVRMRIHWIDIQDINISIDFKGVLQNEWLKAVLKIFEGYLLRTLIYCKISACRFSSLLHVYLKCFDTVTETLLCQQLFDSILPMLFYLCFTYESS